MMELERRRHARSNGAVNRRMGGAGRSQVSPARCNSTRASRPGCRQRPRLHSASLEPAGSAEQRRSSRSRQPGMQESRISLPPLVEGPVRGALRLSLGAPRWAEAAPAHLRQHGIDVVARVAWWGDASGGDLLPLPPPAATAAAACLSTTASFQLRTGPKYLTRYLRDMGALTIAIEAASSSSGSSGSASAAAGGEAAAPQPLATATVGLLALDVASTISAAYPLVLATDAEGAAAGSGSSADGSSAATGAIVGSLEVRLELDYSSSSGATNLVSSFELNEHLAGSTAEAAEEAGATESGSDSGGSGSDDGDAAQPSGLCEQLLAALQDRCACARGEE